MSVNIYINILTHIENLIYFIFIIKRTNTYRVYYIPKHNNIVSLKSPTMSLHNFIVTL